MFTKSLIEKLWSSKKSVNFSSKEKDVLVNAGAEWLVQRSMERQGLDPEKAGLLRENIIIDMKTDYVLNNPRVCTFHLTNREKSGIFDKAAKKARLKEDIFPEYTYMYFNFMDNIISIKEGKEDKEQRDICVLPKILSPETQQQTEQQSFCLFLNHGAGQLRLGN